MEIQLLTERKERQKGFVALAEEFSPEYPYYKEWIAKNEVEYDNFSRVVFAITEDIKVKGYLMVHYCDKESAKINGIYILKEVQGKGYAKRAMQQLLIQLKVAGYKYAFIQTRLHNRVAMRLFHSVGFSVLGKNYHIVEKADNWVAVYNFDNVPKEQIAKQAKKLYGGFEECIYNEIYIPRLVVCIGGKIASGKTYWRKKISEHYHAKNLSVSDWLREIARNEGITDASRADLQRIGTRELADYKKLAHDILRYTGWDEKTNLVLDGIRVLKFYQYVRSIVSPAHCCLIFVDVDEETRQGRIAERNEKPNESVAIEMNNDVIKANADIVISEATSLDEVFTRIRELL